MRVELSEWLPDQPDNNNPGLIKAENVFPGLRSYEPVKNPVAFSDALDSRCLGAYVSINSTGGIADFAGDAGKLYKLVSSTWDDVTKAGGYTAARWTFTQFGQRVIATNFADAVQYYDLGSSTDFADLAGTPPKARYTAVVGEHVVLANIDDATDNEVPNRVQWSGINDTEEWSKGTDPSTLADFQDLPGEGGLITAIVGGTEYGTVFQERAIWRMTFTGSPLAFDFDKIETNRGTIAPGSVAIVGRDVFYLGNDGFYKFNGQYSQPIGSERVNETFFADTNIDFLKERMQAGVDPVRNLVLWAYPSNNAEPNTTDRIIAYNWTTNRWTLVNLVTEFFFSALTTSVTIDGMDSLYASIDDVPFSLDSSVWLGGAPALAAFNSDHKLAYFTGDNLAAEVISQEVELADGAQAYVDWVRPIVDTEEATVALAARDKVYDDATFGGDMALDSTGKCNFRSVGRYHRAKIKIPAGADWTHLQAMDYSASVWGNR